ncbi:MAG: hypothetical protein ACK5VU_11285 [Burkholderiales bacterium]
MTFQVKLGYKNDLLLMPLNANTKRTHVQIHLGLMLVSPLSEVAEMIH